MIIPLGPLSPIFPLRICRCSNCQYQIASLMVSVAYAGRAERIQSVLPPLPDAILRARMDRFIYCELAAAPCN